MGFRLTPGFSGNVATAFFNYDVNVDDYGHRISGVKKNNSEELIAFFGDSFMFGQGVEDDETVPAYVDQQLSADVSVLNAGVYGYTPYQEYLAYQRLVDRWPIDTVVLQIYSNDIVQQGELVQRRVHRGYLNANPPEDMLGEMKSWLFSNFEVVAHLRRAFYMLSLPKGGLPDYLHREYSMLAKQEIDSTRNVIIQWADEAGRRGQRFIIYYMPTVMEMDAAFASQRERWATEFPEYAPGQADQWLRKLVSARDDIEFIDLYKLFETSYSNGGPSLYIVSDGHINAKGNQLIADQVLQLLGRN